VGTLHVNQKHVHHQVEFVSTCGIVVVVVVLVVYNFVRFDTVMHAAVKGVLGHFLKARAILKTTHKAFKKVHKNYMLD